jgi:hypothetical protein
MLAHQLKKGMSPGQVEALLGAPDLSPTKGVYEYSSDRKELVKEAGGEMNVFLVAKFLDARSKVTNKLESWGFTPLGE